VCFVGREGPSWIPLIRFASSSSPDRIASTIPAIVRSPFELRRTWKEGDDRVVQGVGTTKKFIQSKLRNLSEYRGDPVSGAGAPAGERGRGLDRGARHVEEP